MKARNFTKYSVTCIYMAFCKKSFRIWILKGSMCVCECVSVSVCMSVCVHKHKCVSVHMFARIHVHI